MPFRWLRASTFLITSVGLVLGFLVQRNANLEAGPLFESAVIQGGFGSADQGQRAIPSGRPLPSSVPVIPGVQVASEGVYRIDFPRPLATAARLLQQKLGVPISYEEPVWSSDNDLILASDLIQNAALKAKNPGWQGNLVPRNGVLDVILPRTLTDLNVIAVADSIPKVLDNHKAHRNAGEFQLIQFGIDEFAIIPDRVEDKTGRLLAQNSPLEQRISFPEQERSLKATLELILTPLHVGLFNSFYDENLPRVKVGANNERARDVLSRALRQPGGGKLSWHLEYDPEFHAYALSLTGVQIEVSDVRGTLRLQTVRWPKP